MLANESKADPRARRTLKLLQTAMSELLMEKEFSKITVQDIAERADVNRATFYDHFEDKYALLNYIVREDFQMRLDQQLPADPMFTRDNLRLLTLTACTYLRRFLGHCAPSTRHDEQAIMLRQVQINLYDVILVWVKASLSDQNTMLPETIAMVTSSAIFGSVFQWVQNGRKLSAEELTDQVLSLLTAGVGAYLVAPA